MCMCVHTCVLFPDVAACTEQSRQQEWLKLKKILVIQCMYYKDVHIIYIFFFLKLIIII